MRNRLGIFLSLTALIVFAGCAYYNTFFLARQKFDQAEKKQSDSQRSKNNQQIPQVPSGYKQGQAGGTRQQDASQSNVSPEAKTLYKDAIDKANKVLKYHQNSKWVDDALWLIGKSYFSMNDYTMADRSFKELVTNYPQSKFVDRCNFYMGLCQMNLGHEDLALSDFAAVENAPKKSPYLEYVLYAKGMMELNGESYKDAEEDFGEYIKKYPDGDSAAMAQFYIGHCRQQLEDFSGAYAAYDAVKKHNPSKDLYFDAVLASATMALESDSVALGMKILEALSKDQAYFTQLGEIHLRTAEGYYLEKQIDKAIDLYNQITVQNPKTKESAEAYYRLGLIYQSDKFDLDAAKDAFSKALSESPSSEFRYLAQARSAQISKLESYRLQLQKADSIRALGIISPTGPPDSSSATPPGHSQTSNTPGSMGSFNDTISIVPPSSRQAPASLGMDFIGPLPERAVANQPGDARADSTGNLKADNSIVMETQSLSNETAPGPPKVGIDSSAGVFLDNLKMQANKAKDFIGPQPEERPPAINPLGKSVSDSIRTTEIVNAKLIGPVPLPNEISPGRTKPGVDSLAMASTDSLAMRANRLKGFIGPLPEDIALPNNSPKMAAADSIRYANESRPGFIGPRFQDALANNEMSQSPPAGQSKNVPGRAMVVPPAVVNEDSVRQAILDSGIETRYLLAELFAYELNRPDSALQEYLYIVSEYPHSTYAPRALLAAAQIEFDRADSLAAQKYLHRLVSEYPRTPQAVRAAEILANPFDLSENAVGLYAAAESLVYSANMPDSALALYTYIADKFPDVAPQASYAVAWILDQVIGVEDSSAYYAYQDVAQKYPQTAFGKAANDRLKGTTETTDKPRSTTRQEQPEQQPEEQQPDTTIQSAEGLPFAPAIKTAGVFNYPEALYSRDLKGKVTFKIKIDVTGKVRDHEVIGPSGEYAIDSSATAALITTEFDVSQLDLIQLDNYYQYSITFKRPNITIYNNPYLERQERGP